MLAAFIVTVTLLLCVASEQIAKDRAQQRKHGAKPKLHYSSSLAHVETKYGVDLPAFAFDFSELFSGAVIERTTTEDLYLSIFVVGHKSVSTDFPFHAISTDEEVLHAWSKGVNKWGTATVASPPGRHPATAAHAAHNSGLACVIQNNDGSAAHVYQSSAYWVHSQNEKDSSSAGGNFAILRCRIRNSMYVYSNATYGTNQELFVDIMRINPHKRSAGSPHSRNASRTDGPAHIPTAAVVHQRRLAATTGIASTTTSSTTSSSDVSIAADSRGTVLCSFSVPWRTRMVGYPSPPHRNASNLDLWREDGSVSAGSIPAPTPTTATVSSAPSSSAVSPRHDAYLCVPGVRPLHPERAAVPLPMLLEFIEHHLALGYAHIMLGLTLDWRSSYMSKHMYVLQQYVQSGQVSLFSTTLPGFDDVPGFAGIQLNDAYAEQYFLNQCLYVAKGMAKYVTVLRAEEFLIPGAVEGKEKIGGEASSKPAMETSFVSSLVSRFEAHISGDRSSTTRSTAQKGVNCYFALKPATSSRAPGALVGELQVYGVEDPASAFGTWGPGESTWSREFFAQSTPRMLQPSAPHVVHFLPTDRVVRVEVASSGRVSAYCRHSSGHGSHAGKSALPHQAHGYTHAPGTGSAGSAGSAGSGGWSPRSGVAYAAGAALPGDNLAALFVYKGAFPAKLFATAENATAASAEALKQFTTARGVINVRIAEQLKSRGMGGIKEVKALVKKSAEWHGAAVAAAEHSAQLHVHGDLAHHVASTKNSVNGAKSSVQVSAAASGAVQPLPARAEIKSPFWQLCNTDYLKDVIKRVFHGV